MTQISLMRSMDVIGATTTGLALHMDVIKEVSPQIIIVEGSSRNS